MNSSIHHFSASFQCVPGRIPCKGHAERMPRQNLFFALYIRYTIARNDNLAVCYSTWYAPWNEQLHKQCIHKERGEYSYILACATNFF